MIPTTSTRFLLEHPALESRLKALNSPIEIPALPELYLRLRHIIDSPAGNASKMATVLAQDPALSMKILHIVNAPAFALRQQVSRVEQAVSLLGMEEVSNIVLSATLLRSFPVRAGHRHLDLRRFWEHSIATAIFARILGTMAHASSAIPLDDTFLAGLIHDIGKLILLQNFHDDFASALDLCKNEKTTLLQAEQKVLRFTHQDIGAYVADQWNFARHLVKATELHNSPDDLDTGDSAYCFVSLIHVADLFAHAMRMGDSGDPFIPVFSNRAFEALVIPLRNVPQILAQGRASYADMQLLTQT